MHDQRHAERGPRTTGQIRSVCARRRRQARAGYKREIHPGLLEHRAVLQHASATATAFGTLPCILDKPRVAIGRFQRGADAILQVVQEGLHGSE